jgi:hypothetical protein
MVNKAGVEVIVTGAIEARWRRLGRMDALRPREFAVAGPGEPMTVLLDLRMNGLGDAIHSLPAIAEKVRLGFHVIVITTPFLEALFTRIGCTVLHHDIPAESDALRYVGTSYNLKMWCTEMDADSGPERLQTSRFGQFARLVNVELPKEFDFRRHLLALQ